MRELIYSSVFQKQLKKLYRKHYDISKLRIVLTDLIEQDQLNGKHHDHPLTGDMQGYRECHVQSNWLVIYKLSDNQVELVATGSHDDLLK